jgi:hypothetical protein
LPASIKAAPIVRNFQQESRTLSATLRAAQALASRRLLPQGQTRKCLQIIHRMILF